MTIVFKTPGLIPIESFTTFGINSKPSTTSAIGFFGTGLKYAVAVLCRMNIPVEVWIGETCYHFYAAKKSFRGKEFNFISMKRRNGLGKWFGHTRLPFTTELGKNWELWQAFRELHSNTLDELGQTFQISFDEPVVGVAGQTHIVIPGEEMAKVWNKRGDIFLEGGVQTLSSGDKVQVFHRKSPYLYYRGLRVFTLQKPSLFTWNFLESMQLTEDRTLAAQYLPAFYAVRHVAASTDKDFIKAVLQADEGTWEHSFDYSNISGEPTQQFLEMARIYGRRSALGGYLRIHDPVTRSAVASMDWRDELLGVLDVKPDDIAAFTEWDEVERVVKKHRSKLCELLRADLKEHPKPGFVALPALPLRASGVEALAAATGAAIGDAGDEPFEGPMVFGVVEVSGTVTGRLDPAGSELEPESDKDEEIPF